LDSSLSEFDKLLLREQELLEQQREAAAAASGDGGASGGEAGDGGDDPTDGADAERRAAQVAGGTGGSPDRPGGEPVDSSPGAPVGGAEGDSDNDDRGRVPPDVGDGSNDDIVARQLREAAMEEDDPKLRERLWEEYRVYKRGTRKGS
jgi:hypothetical protein